MRNSLQKRLDRNGIQAQPPSSDTIKGGEQPSKQANSDGLYRKRDSSGSDREELEGRKQPITNIRLSGGMGSSEAYSKKMTTVEDKRRSLHRYKYINQLARLDYQQKMGEVYTKYTKLSKVSAIKKIMAKNQIAEFEEEEEDENLGFDELIEFKYGKDKSQKFHFQKEQINEYEFCEDCDTVHNDHPEAHIVICEKKRKEQPELYSPYSEQYMTQSLYRIKLVVEKIKSTQYEELNNLLVELEKITNPSRSIFVKNKAKVLEGIRELKKTYYNDSVFVKIIAKVCYLIEKM